MSENNMRIIPIIVAVIIAVIVSLALHRYHNQKGANDDD